MKSNHLLFVLIAAVAWLTSACTPLETKTAMKDDINTYFSAVTANDRFKPKANDTFVWYHEPLLSDQNQTVASPKATKRFIEKQIEAELLLKKYEMTDSMMDADYMIGAAIILDDSEMSQQISNFVKVFPGIRHSISDYKEGSLLVVITKPGDMSDDEILWRGAIQAYIVDDQLSKEESQLRVQSFIKQLMKSLPEGN
jgi:hypothetical protein